jgi:rhodanese-related sulfurtransferase
MDAREARSLLGKVTFLDVRTQGEFEAGHVDGSVHITLQEIPARFEELDKETTVVVVCQVGQRSGLAARFLGEQGYDAHNLEGGLEAWVQQGLPLATSAGQGEVIDGWAEDLTW